MSVAGRKKKKTASGVPPRKAKLISSRQTRRSYTVMFAHVHAGTRPGLKFKSPPVEFSSMVAPRGICGIWNATEINLLRGLLILKFAESGLRCEKEVGIVFQKVCEEVIYRDCFLFVASNDEFLSRYHLPTNFN